MTHCVVGFLHIVMKVFVKCIMYNKKLMRVEKD